MARYGKLSKQLGVILGALSFLSIAAFHTAELRILIHLPDFGDERASLLWGTAFLPIGFGLLLFAVLAAVGYSIGSMILSRAHE